MSADPAIQYAQSTAPTGTIGVFGTSAVSATSEATVASYGVLETGITRMSPQASSAVRTTVPASPATFSGVGWRMGTPVFATDNARTLGGQNWPVTVRVRTTATITITTDVTVILYLDDREIGRATLATNAITSTASDLALSVPITAGVVSNTTTPKVTMEVYLNATLGASLAYTLILATGTTVTSVDPGVLAQDATRTGTETPPVAVATATRQTSAVRVPTDAFPAATDTSPRVVTNNRTGSDVYTTSTQTASRVVTNNRAASDTLSAQIDTASRVATQARLGSDALPAMAGTASRTTALARNATDNQSFVDTASRVASVSRVASDSQPFVDTAPRSVTFARLGADVIPSTPEVSARQTSDFRRGSDNLAVQIGTASRVVSLSITAADYLATIDSAARSLTFLRVTLYQFQPSDDAPSNQIKTVAGFVYKNDSTPYLGGATVILIRDDGIVVKTTTSSTVDGSYSFPRNFTDNHTYTVAAHTAIAGAPYQAVTPRTLVAV